MASRWTTLQSELPEVHAGVGDMALSFEELGMDANARLTSGPDWTTRV
jgi:hypothetical protein